MQTKLTFCSYTINNGRIVQTYEKEPIIINESSNEKLQDKTLIFSEYDKIIIKFESDDDNAFLEIDSSMSEYPLQIKSSDEIVVLTEAGAHESMLTPGYYGIRVITSFKTYTGLYLIKSKSVDWDGIVNLRRYLETVMAGLSQNLYIQRMVGQKNVYGDENYSISKMYSYIKNNIESVINSIDSIIKNPLTDVKKEYKEQYYSKKSDLKSQRWLCTKGLNKNKNIHFPDIVYEKKSFLNKDTTENCYTKQILQKILEYVISFESSYQIVNNDLIKTIEKKTKKYNSEKIMFEKVRDDRIVSPEHKYNKGKELEFLKNDIYKLIERSKFMEETMLILRKIKAMLLRYINETWLNEISYLNKRLKLSQKILKDNRYYQIYDFYLNLCAIEQDEPKTRKPYFPSKNSPKLFEYYSVVLVINILMNNRFEWKNGWLANNVGEELFNGEIPTDKPLVFISKDSAYRIEVLYEKIVQSNTTVMENNISDFVRMNATHYKPDIMVSMFDNKTGELIKTVVVEVKCCKSDNLQTKNGPSKAIEQVKNYYNFGYYDKEIIGRNKTKRAVVEEIIILYPKQEKVIQYQYDDLPLCFIQIEANDLDDVTKHYGYSEFENEVMSCLAIF
ncbi:MAG: hypothetical protein K0R54_4996 [Clostridiaceae bacterium]|nr:hypothetical protein [Clostridiaceae bacterium]